MDNTELSSEKIEMSISCKLCNLSFPKLIKAHIIPKSFYGKETSADEGPARLLSTQPFFRSPRSQIGEYDEELVCASCEKYFAELDDYAHRILYKDTPKQIFHNNKHLADDYTTYDREVFRQFVLSLLWRMSATSRKTFSIVRLGNFQITISESLKNRDSSYAPFVDAVISKFDGPLSEAFLFPTKLRIDGINGYRVCFAKYSCWIVVDQRPLPSPFDALSISKHSYLRVMRRDFTKSPELRAMKEMVRRSEA